MKRFTFILVLLFLAAEAQCISENDKIEIRKRYADADSNGSYRSNSISADIDGNLLSIYFLENVGIAHIVISRNGEVYIDNENVFSTPHRASFIIADAGDYRMDITLNNGEQYYGCFSVTE